MSDPRVPDGEIHTDEALNPEEVLNPEGTPLPEAERKAREEATRKGGPQAGTAGAE